MPLPAPVTMATLPCSVRSMTAQSTTSLRLPDRGQQDVVDVGPHPVGDGAGDPPLQLLERVLVPVDPLQLAGPEGGVEVEAGRGAGRVWGGGVGGGVGRGRRG